MGTVIAAINVTIDGNSDHREGIPDDAMHQHYAELLQSADVILYGRIIYQLMEYWRTVAHNPTGNKSQDNFAMIMNRIPKIVFSNTIKDLSWTSARLSKHDLQTEVSQLKKEDGKKILVGSPGLITQLTNLGLIDEYQICIHPVIAGPGLQLFKNIERKVQLTLLDTKTFGSGAIVLYYQPKYNVM